MMKKPSYLSKGALLLKRRRVGATRNWNGALKGKETGTDHRGGTEKTENDPSRDKETLETTWDHLSPSCNSGIHLRN